MYPLFVDKTDLKLLSFYIHKVVNFTSGPKPEEAASSPIIITQRHYLILIIPRWGRLSLQLSYISGAIYRSQKTQVPSGYWIFLATGPYTENI